MFKNTNHTLGSLNRQYLAPDELINYRLNISLELAASFAINLINLLWLNNFKAFVSKLQTWSLCMRLSYLKHLSFSKYSMKLAGNGKLFSFPYKELVPYGRVSLKV